MNALLLGLAIAVAAPGTKDKDKPTPKLEGDWIVEAIEGEKKELKGETRFTFTADQIKIKEAARDRTEDAGYKADFTKTPAELDIMPGKGNMEIKVQGIIKVEGDKMTICFATGAERPKEFKVEDGKRMVMITLKRAKGKD